MCHFGPFLTIIKLIFAVLARVLGKSHFQNKMATARATKMVKKIPKIVLNPLKVIYTENNQNPLKNCKTDGSGNPPTTPWSTVLIF